jgi:hypothetical protein
MSNGDIVVNLLLSPTEINFLQVAVDGLIDVQRDVIHDCAISSDRDVVESGKDAIERLQAGLGLKHTLEVYNL